MATLPGLAALAALFFTWLQVGQTSEQLGISEQGQNGVADGAQDAFRNLVRDRLGALAELQILWSAPRLICIAGDFTGTAVSRATLMGEVWDENWFGPTKSLDVTMAGLRRRLTQAAEESDRPCRLPHMYGRSHRRLSHPEDRLRQLARIGVSRPPASDWGP